MSSEEPESIATPTTDDTPAPEQVETTTDWRTALDADTAKSVAPFKTEADLAKGYANLSKMLGGEKIPVPRDETDHEAWSQVWNRLGRPEQPDGYEVPDDYKDAIDQSQAREFFTKAHEMGLTKRQAAELMHFDMARAAAARDGVARQEQQTVESMKSELKAEYGPAIDDKLRIAREFVVKFTGGDPELAKEVANSPFFNDPKVVKMLVNAGQALMSDPIKGKGASAQFALSPAEALAKIESLKSNPVEFTRITNNPKSSDAIELDRLYQIAYGSQ